MKEIKFKDLGILEKPTTFRIDLKNKIVHCNRNFLKLIGKDNKEEVINKLSIEDLVEGILPEKIFMELIEKLIEGKHYHGFLRFKRNDEEYIWVELIGDSHKEEDIKKGFAFMCKNVSEIDKEKYNKLYGSI